MPRTGNGRFRLAQLIALIACGCAVLLLVKTAAWSLLGIIAALIVIGFGTWTFSWVFRVGAYKDRPFFSRKPRP
jgi:hypothetical protein